MGLVSATAARSRLRAYRRTLHCWRCSANRPAIPTALCAPSARLDVLLFLLKPCASCQELFPRLDGKPFYLTVKNTKPNNRILGFAWVDAQLIMVACTGGLELHAVRPHRAVLLRVVLTRLCVQVDAQAATAKFVRSGGVAMSWYRYLVRLRALPPHGMRSRVHGSRRCASLRARRRRTVRRFAFFTLKSRAFPSCPSVSCRCRPSPPTPRSTVSSASNSTKCTFA